MGILARFFSKPLRAEVENSIVATGKVVALWLMQRYTPQFGEQTAASLAAAVTNGLFGKPPGNETGRQFLAANRGLVETLLCEVKSEARICQMITVLAHTKSNILGNTGTVTPEMVTWIAKLRDLGILLPLESVTLPSSPDEMRRQVREFEALVTTITIRELRLSRVGHALVAVHRPETATEKATCPRQAWAW